MKPIDDWLVGFPWHRNSGFCKLALPRFAFLPTTDRFYVVKAPLLTRRPVSQNFAAEPEAVEAKFTSPERNALWWVMCCCEARSCLIARSGMQEWQPSIQGLPKWCQQAGVVRSNRIEWSHPVPDTEEDMHRRSFSSQRTMNLSKRCQPDRILQGN